MTVLALVLSASRPASAQTPPPATGEWVVDDHTDWSGNVTLYGALKITPNGSLSLSNAGLVFDCPSRAAFGITVQSGGRLNATGCAFSAINASLPYTFLIQKDAVVNLEYSTIRNVGSFTSTMDNWGICVLGASTNITHCKIDRCNVGVLVPSNISPTIAFNDISNNSDRGIWLRAASPVISNNRFSNDGYAIYLENDSVPVLINNEFADNQKDAVYFGSGCMADWSIDAPVAWVNSTINLRGNLTVKAGGALTMRQSSLLLVSTADARKYLKVLAGGNLSLLGGSAVDVPAVLNGIGAYAFDIQSGGGLTISDSGVHNAGYDSVDLSLAGMFVQSRAEIAGGNLTGNLAAIVCQDAVIQVTNTTLGGDWHLRLANSTVRLLNSTYIPSKVRFEDSSSILEVSWYLSAGTVWQNGQGAEGAVLTIRDFADNAIFEGTPGPDGWVRWLEAIQLRVTKAGPEDLSRYTLLANRTGFSDVGRTVQMSSNRAEMLVFNDTVPPLLTVTFPQNGFGTNQTWVVFTGEDSDPIGLERVELMVDDSLHWLPLAKGSWSCNVTDLTSTVHHVEVRATDHAGLSTYVNISFVVDLEPPRLRLDDPMDAVLLVNHTGIHFSGSTNRDINLTIDGTPVQLTADGTFDKTVVLTEGYHRVVVMAKDQGGNIVTIVREITVDTVSPVITVHSPSNGTKTGLEEINLVGKVEPGAKFTVDGSTVDLGADGSFNTTVRLAGGPQKIELYAEDVAGNGNTTVWVLDRQLEGGASNGLMARYGIALAVGAVLLVLLVIAGVLVVMRRKKARSPPPGPARGPETPPQGPEGGTPDNMPHWK